MQAHIKHVTLHALAVSALPTHTIVHTLSSHTKDRIFYSYILYRGLIRIPSDIAARGKINCVRYNQAARMLCNR